MNPFQLIKSLGLEVFQARECAKYQVSDGTLEPQTLFIWPAVRAENLEKLLSEGVRVYGSPTMAIGRDPNDYSKFIKTPAGYRMYDTNPYVKSLNTPELEHEVTGLLIGIKPIEKKPCEHMPSYMENHEEIKCIHCGIPLVAEWKPKDTP